MRAAYVDAPWTSGLPGLVNALSHPSTGSPFATLQAAHDYVGALPYGGSLYIPGGLYGVDTLPLFNGLEVSAKVRVFGDGAEKTILSLDGQDPSLHVVRLTSSRAKLSDMRLVGQDVTGTGRGVFIDPSGGSIIRHVELDNLLIQSTPSWGVYVGGHATDASQITILSSIRNCQIQDYKTNGAAYVGNACTTVDFDKVTFLGSSGNGTTGVAQVTVDGAWMTRFHNHCAFEHGLGADCPSLAWKPSVLSYAHGLSIEDCDFEHYYDGSAYWQIEVAPFDNGVQHGHLGGVHIQRNLFQRVTGTAARANQRVRALKITSGLNPVRGSTFAFNRMLENRTSDAAYNDEIYFDGINHEFALYSNDVWDTFSGTVRPLAIGNSYPSRVSRTADQSRYRMPPIAAASLPGSAVEGEIAANSTTHHLNENQGGAGWQPV